MKSIFEAKEVSNFANNSDKLEIQQYGILIDRILLRISFFLIKLTNNEIIVKFMK